MPDAKPSVKSAIDRAPEIVAQIGTIVARWAQMEHTLCSVLQRLLGTDQARAEIVFYSITGARGRCALILKLTKTYLSPKLHREAFRLLRRARRLGATRNLVAHSPFVTNVQKDAARFVHRHFPEDEWSPTLSEKSLKELKSCSDAIGVLHAELASFIFKLGADAVATLPSKWRE